MKQFQFSTPASQEFTAAIRWYESRRLGLGGEFYDAVVQTIDRIRSHPDVGTIRGGRLSHRRFAVAGFPYMVVYGVREDDVYVVALAHTKRRPGYWKDRR